MLELCVPGILIKDFRERTHAAIAGIIGYWLLPDSNGNSGGSIAMQFFFTNKHQCFDVQFGILFS